MEAIKRICRIPADFRKGSKSFHELVHDTGIERRALTEAQTLATERHAGADSLLGKTITELESALGETPST